MIRIENTVQKTQKNFWNHCLFHPTDAVEDPWGKRILDRLARDGSIGTVRIYAMLEDIVYFDEKDQMQFDFRLNDLRIDYLLEKGFDLLIAYAGMPDCIAESCLNKTSVSKNKTRYKGKMFNTSPPKDPAVWGEICYQYTKHLIERYGEERVASWHLHCFNEPDLKVFFLSELDREAISARLEAYCKMYEAFEKGVLKASERLTVGGPALASHVDFLEGFLDFVKEKSLRLDYIALHNYGTSPKRLNAGERPLSVSNNMEKHRNLMDAICAKGFGDREIIYDEWGGATAGFFNREEAPDLMFRETEVFSAYYAKLIRRMINDAVTPSKMLICLSGQHEMVEDFTGFRNFFTLNFIAKPIYNAFRLAARLGEELLSCEGERENLPVVPTRCADGSLAVLLSYSGETFEEDLPVLEEEIVFEEDIAGKTVTLWCIDKEHTNPYRLYQKMGIGVPSEEEIALLRREGELAPLWTKTGENRIKLTFAPNSTYLITVG